MMMPRPLARLLAAVIVMIAAGVGASVVGASSAQAHQGHAHQGHAHHATSVDAPAATAPVLAEARIAAEGPRRILAASDEAPAARPCNGLCCLMSASCCVPGLLPDGLAAIPALTVARRLMAGEDALPAGIVPDSPARPPRPFA
ncbi:hypothetical protein [Methylobacterium nonmethylotrophicum]|uniref:Uncharacterized protein n=1 Tax=Methylobacterium nonmethylotrophicum TaxID=1141884 RepID=A0A4Z0NK30_9HYPH|nr:hypothetical protein [Methylobacterium nonmethylotrophicum]TGD95843.1 hypothetical protein EU555_25905 [Methylobacterium nonmethylotrophicum]